MTDAARADTTEMTAAPMPAPEEAAAPEDLSKSEGGATLDLPADWRQQAARGDHKIAKALESVADVGALAASYAELRTAVSAGRFADKIVVPADDAPAAEWAKFQAALPEHLRAPETPDDYALDTPAALCGPDGGPTAATQAQVAPFLAAMHEAGASGAQVQAALDSYGALIESAAAAQAQADERYLQDADAALRREWGADYERNKAVAERAVTALFGADSEIANLALQDGPLLGSLPAFLRGMAEVGRLLGEDAMVAGGAQAGDTLQEQIDSITTRTMADGSYYTVAVQETLRPLYDQLHGTDPADGRGVG